LNGPEWVALNPIRHSSSYVDLQGGIEEWSGRRQSKFNREVRRRTRLQEAEGFRHFSTTQAGEIVKRLPAAQSLYTERQRARGGQGYRFDAKMVAAIEDIVSTTRPGQLRLVTIERDEIVMAMQLELRAGHRISA
jgi:CelD/BcsL family acetyltransferase involved in cellulose biosynthesis